MNNLVAIRIVMTKTNGKPAIELRRAISDEELIKEIVYCACHEQPIAILPIFSDKISSMNKLIEMGFVKKNEKNEYYFT